MRTCDVCVDRSYLLMSCSIDNDVVRSKVIMAREV